MPATALNATVLSPGLTASDLQTSIRFYTDGLGFEIEERHESDGVLRYVSLKSGAASIGVGQDDFKKGRDRVKGIGFRMWISTDADIVALANRVKAAGFTIDAEPAPLPWGPLGFSLADPDGFLIGISNNA